MIVHKNNNMDVSLKCKIMLYFAICNWACYSD